MRLPFKNHTVFAGYVGNDAPLRYLTSGDATVSVRIVAKSSYKDPEGNWQSIDEWATAVFYRRLAEEFAERKIAKGDFIHVEGRRHTRRWTDGGGYEKTAHEIVVAEWHQVSIAGGTEKADVPEAPAAQPPRKAKPKERAAPNSNRRAIGALA